MLASGARYVGNIDLPPNDGPGYITDHIRRQRAASGTRVSPRLCSGKLAIIQSPNGFPARRRRERAPTTTLHRRGVPRRRRRRQRPRNDQGHRQRRRRHARRTPALLPSHFIFDRVLIRGDATYGAKRGILGNGHDITLKYSDVREHLPQRARIRAGSAATTAARLPHQHNWMEAGTEVILFGGAASPAHTVAEDIIIEDNVLTRPLAWKALAGPTYNVKNILELKEGIDVTIRRNYLEYNWPPSQPGYAVADHGEGLQEDRQRPLRRQRRQEHGRRR